MLEVIKYDKSGKQSGKVQLDEAIFGVPSNDNAVKELLLMQLANRRMANPNTKTRAEVRGGGKKPWKQKGTGRARAGSSRSPIWVGGGVAHGPDEQNHKKAMPRKMRRLALRSILSDKVRAGSVCVMEDPAIQQPKTKAAISLVQAVGGTKVLFIQSARAEGEVQTADKAIHSALSNLELSTRNLQNAKTLVYRNLNPHDLLNFDRIVILQSALDKLKEVVL